MSSFFFFSFQHFINGFSRCVPWLPTWITVLCYILYTTRRTTQKTFRTLSSFFCYKPFLIIYTKCSWKWITFCNDIWRSQCSYFSCRSILWNYRFWNFQVNNEMWPEPIYWVVFGSKNLEIVLCTQKEKLILMLWLLFHIIISIST